MKIFHKNMTKHILAGLAIVALAACDFEYDIAEAGSIEDLTPPTASFSASQSDSNFLLYNFANESVSATTYSWDFGDGNTSTETDPSNTYPAEGTYTVSLTASDALGASSTYTMDITVVEPEEPEAITPVLGAPDFEDGVDANCLDSRDCWRIDGATIHQTTSDGQDDSRGAKYPSGSDNNRVSYQAFTVSPNTKYRLIANYALQSDGDSVRASVINGQLSHFDEFADAELLGQASGTINDGKGNFNELIIEFETGANGDISILFDHDGNASDAYLDNVSVVPVEE